MPVIYGIPQARHDLELVALRPRLTVHRCSLHPRYDKPEDAVTERQFIPAGREGKAHMHGIYLCSTLLVAGQLHSCHAVRQSMTAACLLLVRAALHTNIASGHVKATPVMSIQDPQEGDNGWRVQSRAPQSTGALEFGPQPLGGDVAGRHTHTQHSLLLTPGQSRMYPAPCPAPERDLKAVDNEIESKAPRAHECVSDYKLQALVVLGALALWGPCVGVKQACLRPSVRGHPWREFSVVVGGRVQLEAKDPGDVVLNGLEGSVGSGDKWEANSGRHELSGKQTQTDRHIIHVSSCWLHGMNHVLCSPEAIQTNEQVAAMSGSSRPQLYQQMAKHSTAHKSSHSCNDARTTQNKSALGCTTQARGVANRIADIALVLPRKGRGKGWRKMVTTKDNDTQRAYT